MIMATRMLLTINLRRYLVTQPRTKRKAKAIKYIRERVSHFTKTDIENVLLTQDLNDMVLKSYAKHMYPVKLSVKIDAGKATAEPQEKVKEEVKETKGAKDTKQTKQTVKEPAKAEDKSKPKAEKK